tara:strand:+ start:243 stop:1106 length:864 start_codon:yes stop_codon:yes gene_type:complete
MSSWKVFLRTYREERRFSSKYFVRSKVKKLNEYLGKHNLSGAVLSVSGGVDSALTLALLKQTAELPNSNLKKIWAISQPIHSSDWALARAKELCEKMEIELKIIDQTELYDNITKLVSSVTDVTENKFSGGQLRSYMRTPINYYCAQLLSQMGYPAIVMGTGNMDEDGYLAYFCKAGDGVVDVQLIADLHKSEVFKCAEYLGVPDSIVKAKPSADLWDGQEDEKELGFTYDFIEFYTGWYLKLNEEQKKNFITQLSDNSYSEFIQFEERCVSIHNRNKHKISGVVNL